MIVGLCKFHVLHRGMTPGRMKEKKCIEKNCKYLIKINRKYWVNKELSELGEKIKRRKLYGKEIEPLIQRKNELIDMLKRLEGGCNGGTV